MDRWVSQRNVTMLKGQKYGWWKFTLSALLTDLKVIKDIIQPIPETNNDTWTDAE